MTIQDSAVALKLKRKSQKFKEHLTKRFNWDFDEEPEDDAPVVVEIWRSTLAIAFLAILTSSPLLFKLCCYEAHFS